MKGGTELPLRRLGPGSRFEKTPFDDGAGGHDPRTLLTVRLEYSFGSQDRGVRKVRRFVDVSVRSSTPGV